MDYVKRAPKIEDFWTPAVLRDQILQCAFHAQGHARSCRCPWCFEGETLQIILDHRPDLIHASVSEGGQCGEECRHVRYVREHAGG